MVPDRVEHATVVILGSDDGLCGAYNVNLFKFLLGHIADLRDRYGEGVHINIVTVGKKMDKAVRKIATHRISVETAPVNSKAEGDAVKAFNDELQRRFIDGETGRIDIVYQNFKSISRQRPVAAPMLPLSVESFSAGEAAETARPYIFEPDAASIFATVLPMYLLALVQEVFGETGLPSKLPASWQCSRPTTTPKSSSSSCASNTTSCDSSQSQTNFSTSSAVKSATDTFRRFHHIPDISRHKIKILSKIKIKTYQWVV